MLKNRGNRTFIILKKIVIFIFSFLFLYFIYLKRRTDSTYSFFIEFNNANGLVIGTPIRMRGVIIGSINKIQLKLNCVLALATINSDNIIISKSSLIETTQTGLLNESVIDIIPLEHLILKIKNGPLSPYCDSSSILCHNMYILGERGLNYDDLVRSTTRISQRFDDPRLFNLFYLFLQSGIDLLDTFSLSIKNIFNICNI